MSIFAFASTRAISRYDVHEILEMGIDGLWIGYEGSNTDLAKRRGRPLEDLFRELREHGITILASMILGMPYQDEETVERELDTLLQLNPTFCQFLIYAPTPGTPFYERVMEEGSLRDDLATNPQRYYRRCHGFTSMVRHPSLTADEIEGLQRHCYEEDFQRLGPSVFRSVETTFKGSQNLESSGSAALRRKARWFSSKVRNAYPVFLTGRCLAPNRKVRDWIASLQKSIHRQLGPPTFVERLQSLVVLGAALFTAFKLRFKLLQQPRLVRHAYRLPIETSRAGRAWRRIADLGLPVSVEMHTHSTVWVRLYGKLRTSDVRRLVRRMRAALRNNDESLVLDLEKLPELDKPAAEQLASRLGQFRSRIRILMPSSLPHPRVAACLAPFTFNQ